MENGFRAIRPRSRIKVKRRLVQKRPFILTDKLILEKERERRGNWEELFSKYESCNDSTEILVCDLEELCRPKCSEKRSSVSRKKHTNSNSEKNNSSVRNSLSSSSISSYAEAGEPSRVITQNVRTHNSLKVVEEIEESKGDNVVSEVLSVAVECNLPSNVSSGCISSDFHSSGTDETNKEYDIVEQSQDKNSSLLLNSPKSSEKFIENANAQYSLKRSSIEPYTDQNFTPVNSLEHVSMTKSDVRCGKLKSDVCQHNERLETLVALNTLMDFLENPGSVWFPLPHRKGRKSLWRKKDFETILKGKSKA